MIIVQHCTKRKNSEQYCEYQYSFKNAAILDQWHIETNIVQQALSQFSFIFKQITFHYDQLQAIEHYLCITQGKQACNY